MVGALSAIKCGGVLRVTGSRRCAQVQGSRKGSPGRCVSAETRRKRELVTGRSSRRAKVKTPKSGENSMDLENIKDGSVSGYQYWRGGGIRSEVMEKLEVRST